MLQPGREWLHAQSVVLLGNQHSNGIDECSHDGLKTGMNEICQHKSITNLMTAVTLQVNNNKSVTKTE